MVNLEEPSPGGDQRPGCCSAGPADGSIASCRDAPGVRDLFREPTQCYRWSGRQQASPRARPFEVPACSQGSHPAGVQGKGSRACSASGREEGPTDRPGRGGRAASRTGDRSGLGKYKGQVETEY